MPGRKPYPSEVADEAWALVAPCLTLLPEAAGQREHPLQEAFNGLRSLVRHGVAWRAMAHAPCRPGRRLTTKRNAGGGQAVLRRWCMDVRGVLRLARGRSEEPSAAVLRPPHPSLHARE